MSPEAAELRDLANARIRVLISSIASGADPDGRARQMVAALYPELGMRGHAARWLVEAAELVAEVDREAALKLAREAVAADPENADAQQLVAKLAQRKS